MSLKPSDPLLPFVQEGQRQKQLRTKFLIGACTIIGVVGLSCGLIFGLRHKSSNSKGGDSEFDGRQGFLSLSINGSDGSADTIMRPAPLMLGARVLTANHSNQTLTSGDSACYAPPGTWGPVCTSDTGLSSPYANQWIWYHIEAIGDTAVFCKVSAAACQSGGPCCWNWHPRGGAGNPIWNGPIGMIWGNNAGTPQIMCLGSPSGSSLRWSWSADTRNLGCFNGYNCGIPGY